VLEQHAAPRHRDGSGVLRDAHRNRVGLVGNADRGAVAGAERRGEVRVLRRASK
jgi:hypothetical protein